MFRSATLAAAAAAVLAFPMTVRAQGTAMPDSDYIAKIMTAAPAAIVKNATIVEMNPDGSMRTVQTGNDGFTCMMLGTAPGCADQNAMAWMKAYSTHSTPPAGVGFMYMLAGDDGASNTDPYARAETTTNHWIKTGPHVMIVGPAVQNMGYPATADADPTKVYVMWAGTPYAHVMIPTSVQP